MNPALIHPIVNCGAADICNTHCVMNRKKFRILSAVLTIEITHTPIPQGGTPALPGRQLKFGKSSGALFAFHNRSVVD